MNLINEKSYVDTAEAAIKKLKDKTDQRGKPIQMVTTSKIRNLLAMTMDIYNQVLLEEDGELSDDMKGRIDYLRVRFLYEAGREPKVMDFVKESKTINILKEVGEKKDFMMFARYMESLVAFHKYYGGREC